ncbi:MAG: alpha/beta hydrolase [Legionellaceae bacterium]|nr:alpha/beta hydrolase [Legionellaceae bacterium]
MDWSEQLAQAGEHSLWLDGEAGQIEALLSVPPQCQQQSLVFLGHPNSLQGGSMHNKVVTTLARACRERGLASLRMNFRGVGQSAGHYDDGQGESRDMLALALSWQQQFPQARAVFAGFSFGSYVTYRAAAQMPHRLLLSIAPAVDRHAYTAFSPPPKPWEIIMGEADDIVAYDEVAAFAQSHHIPLHPFPETGHFFHGRLLELRACIIQIFAAHGL